MYYADNEKWGGETNVKNRTTKSGKQLNVWREEQLQKLGNIEIRYH